MPTKKTKKVATKPVAKKTPAKKAVKKVVKPVAVAKPVVSEIALPDPYCHCTKRKRNTILTSVFIGSFLLGFFTYHIFFCDGHHFPHNMPKPEFVNGCVDTASIKCPKMLEDVMAKDINHDGCITEKEMYPTKKKAMRHHKKPAQVQEPAVVDAIAPVME